jgi:hypothetical protein
MFKRCAYCRKEITETALFCPFCGEKLPNNADIPMLKTYLDLNLPIRPQLREQFFLSLKIRMEKEHPTLAYNVVAERIYTSGFRDELSPELEKLAASIEEDLKMEFISIPYLNLKVENLFEDQMDLFLLRYARDLIPDAFPEDILTFQHWLPGELDWVPLIAAYLQPALSGVRYYMNFKTLDPIKIKQFTTYFLFPEPLEKIFFVADLSFLGNGSEGFALTDKAIYWKVPFKKEKSIPYHLIRDVRAEKSWLLLNDHYFHANAFIHSRLMRLLSKLIRLSR